ncbi:MAG: signal peptide peptidase SppA [Bacteroidaceae bacterium]
MKQFFLNIFSTILGVFAAGLALIVLVFLAFLLLVGIRSSTSEVAEHSVLHLPLSGVVTEQATDNTLSSLLHTGDLVVSLDEVRKALDLAATNDKIKGVYLEAGMLEASPAELQTIHEALSDFKKKSKKFIVAYGDLYSQGSYYVCSVADKLVLNPSGAIAWHGLSAEPMFLKDMLAKVGVKMQVFKVGSYKSAVEPYTSTEMSKANREQVGSYLHSIWSHIVSDVSKSRHIAPDSLQLLADQYMAFAPSQRFVEQGMVDTLLYRDGVKAWIKDLCHTHKKVHFITPSQLVATAEPQKRDKNEIAIYYAYGDVISTNQENVGNTSTLCAESMIADLEKLADDEQVKAVVLRLNSGGGSAYASEQIWRAVTLLKQKKPVVVSMGGMAASGAYYIASAANVLVAQPTTLTGSIGIFGIFPDASELLTEKLGLHFDHVKTNRHSDFGTLSRPLNREEQQMLQLYIERGYNLFLTRVATGRHKSIAATNAVAQGRVWTGEQALKIGLVDALGGLPYAMERAAKLANVKKDYQVGEYPAVLPWYETWLSEESDRYLDEKMRTHLGLYYAPLSFLTQLKKQDYVQARIPYYISIK